MTLPASIPQKFPRAGSADLGERYARAIESLRACRLCPRACGANRLAGESGFCGASGRQATVASVSIHHGEEPPISGTNGSGTVFFSRCNMACLFCQNYPISQMGVGAAMTVEELGERLLWIGRKGAHNVNFVTPTPHIPQLIGALAHARERGLALPVVYNTNGYESALGLSLLEGIVDIYLPDIKWLSAGPAGRLAGAPDYPVHNGAAVAEMIRQVGRLAVGADGIATRGVLIRHLVLPGQVEETARVLAHVREAFGPETPLSLMGQYFPAHRAAKVRGLDRKLAAAEYDKAVAAAESLGLENVFIQEMDCPSVPT